MNAQDATLGVALIGFLGTLSVQLINFLSTNRTKAIDERQKQEDRKQELRKLYLSKKLEAGEVVVARATLMTQLLHFMHSYYSTLDASEYNDDFNATRHQRLQNELDRINAILLSDKNAGLLYYARLPNYNKTEEEMVRHNRLLTEMCHLDNEVDMIFKLFNETDDLRSKQNIRASMVEKGTEMQDKIEEYLQCNTLVRNLLNASCDEIHRQISVYELP